MGRKVLDITADKLHAHDVLLGRAAGEEWRVERVVKRGRRVTVHVYGGQSYTVDAHYLVRVVAQHECHCGGSGRYRGGGAVVNGVYQGFEGPCFGCSGKGYQSRADVIRNLTYWNKYARISA